MLKKFTSLLLIIIMALSSVTVLAADTKDIFKTNETAMANANGHGITYIKDLDIFAAWGAGNATSGGAALITSKDGLNWTRRLTSWNNTNNPFAGFAYGNEKGIILLRAGGSYTADEILVTDKFLNSYQEVNAVAEDNATRLYLMPKIMYDEYTGKFWSGGYTVLSTTKTENTAGIYYSDGAVTDGKMVWKLAEKYETNKNQYIVNLCGDIESDGNGHIFAIQPQQMNESKVICIDWTDKTAAAPTCKRVGASIGWGVYFKSLAFDLTTTPKNMIISSSANNNFMLFYGSSISSITTEMKATKQITVTSGTTAPAYATSVLLSTADGVLAFPYKWEADKKNDIYLIKGTSMTSLLNPVSDDVNPLKNFYYNNAKDRYIADAAYNPNTKIVVALTGMDYTNHMSAASKDYSKMLRIDMSKLTDDYAVSNGAVDRTGIEGFLTEVTATSTKADSILLTGKKQPSLKPGEKGSYGLYAVYGAGSNTNDTANISVAVSSAKKQGEEGLVNGFWVDNWGYIVVPGSLTEGTYEVTLRAESKTYPSIFREDVVTVTVLPATCVIRIGDVQKNSDINKEAVFDLASGSNNVTVTLNKELPTGTANVMALIGFYNNTTGELEGARIERIPAPTASETITTAYTPASAGDYSVRVFYWYNTLAPIQ